MSQRIRTRALAAALLAAALAAGGCGRLGQDAGAIFAAHDVLRRELPQFQIDFSESHIVSRERPYYMIELTARLTLGDGERPEDTTVRSFLVVLALNPDNGVQFRWHPGAAVTALDGPKPPSAVVAEMKARNRWGAAIDWSRRLHASRG
ncbi:MAG TPA: hypothetical protein ENK20_00830 [Chromatiales bacterium]|nr:hypothetical protein [Chromatiales bacterium]